jgi:phosphoserine aminotransferase
LASLSTDTLGRSHRSSIGKATLKKAIDESKRLLGLPDDYLLGIVPASDTGAMEMALWSMLGERAVDVCYWESFGQGWSTDIVKQLKLNNVNEITTDYGQLPDLSKTNSANDIVFTWNGTTSGVKVDNTDWIADDREGLTICDATSAVFAMDIPWKKIDVATYSWQKVLGGEGAHGVLILSPRAVERLESFTPDRPLPKIFRMTKGGKLIGGIFNGETINTPSMLAVEDYIDALTWVDSCGGLPAMIERSNRNLNVIENFVAENEWINFLAEDKAIRSNTSVCLKLDLNGDQIKALTKLLEVEQVAYDIGAYRDAPDGLRIWCGATVEVADLEALMPWLAWGYSEVKQS